MRDTVRVWNTRFSVMSVLCLLIGISLYKLNLESQVTYIVSLLAIVVCLVVCLSIKQVKNNIDVVDTPIVMQTIDNCDISYNIKGIRVQDIDKCMEALNLWKEEHGFSFIDNRSTALVAQFRDVGKKEIYILEIPDYISNKDDKVSIIREYSGKFSYYMNGGNRNYKIDDIQLGAISFGVIQNLEDYANKMCHIWLLTTYVSGKETVEIVGIDIIGG